MATEREQNLNHTASQEVLSVVLRALVLPRNDTLFFVAFLLPVVADLACQLDTPQQERTSVGELSPSDWPVVHFLDY